MQAPFRKDIGLHLLEGVQRRATSIKDETYEERQRLVNLTTLETRRLEVI